MNFVQSLNLIGCHGNIKGNFSRKYSKINSSEAVWGIKLKLCRIVSNSTKTLFFIAVAQALWLLWQLKVSIDLQWEKWKLRFIAISLQVFWQKFYRNVPGVVLYKSYEFCPNHWFRLVAMVIEIVNFQKKYSKIFFSEVIRGMKLKLCINVCVIILYIKYVFYCCWAYGFVAMATLSFHRFIIGKVKVGLYF